MSHPLPNRGPSNTKVLSFIVVLSFLCALILSILASALAKPKEIAQELDRSKQMMIAAKVMSHEGYFLVQNKDGKYIPAKFENGVLVPGNANDIPTNAEILEVYKKRFKPFLVNEEGKSFTFAQANINEDEYLSKYKKSGYYEEPYRLIYEILPNQANTEKDVKPQGYVIPVNGYGLWDAIYGYLALEPNANTVIGISWYDQKETPGLGANIAEAPWQNLFPGKHIFQESPDGKTDFKNTSLGITVVKGKVSEVLGDIPKAKSAVDGMAGATLTGYGVTDAYRDVLAAYRQFLIKANAEYKEESKT